MAGTSRADMLYVPAVMHHRDDGDTEHVYRLSSRTWLYSGVSTKPLANYTRSHMAVSRLFVVDIVSIDEFDHAVRKWTLKHPGGSATELADYLHRASHYLYAPSAEPIISEAVARTLLRTHQDLATGKILV